MLDTLKPILKIQDLDIKMIRLMRIKRQRLAELEEIQAVHEELLTQQKEKESEIQNYDKEVLALEEKITELTDKLKKLEEQQSQIKKVEEFNAMTQEMTAVEREKIALEQKTSDLLDNKTVEEEILEKIKESLTSSKDSSMSLKDEINANIALVNEEGQALKKERDQLAAEADAPTLKIYERLLRNKKDRVIVPIKRPILWSGESKEGRIISRILSWTIIHLRDVSPRRLSG